MITIATTEPTEIIAGDTITWQRSLPDYPASDGWVLTYTFINSTSVIYITASASNDDYLVSVDVAVSATWSPGHYQWQAYVTKASERHTADLGSINILPNFATQASYDGRSHARKTLDAIEAVIEKRATLDQQAYTIGNRTLSRTPLPELLAMRDKYRALVQAENRAERISNGLSVNNRLLVRF